jgi:hypothetical protein
MPATFSVGHLAFAGVQAGTDREPKLAHTFDDGACAANRPCGAVERGEESVTGRVDLAPTEAQQLPSDQRVMPLEQLAPAPVAELDASEKYRYRDSNPGFRSERALDDPPTFANVRHMQVQRQAQETPKNAK